MTRPLANPVVTNLLAISDSLASSRGTANLKQMAMRRAVSGAYYAVFHALCGVCADSLVARSKPDFLRAIYRSIDHGPVKRHLLSAAARQIAPDMRRIGDLFAVLQQQRHAADYEPAGPVFDLTQTLATISEARVAVALIQQLDADARMALAILLLVNKRSA